MKLWINNNEFIDFASGGAQTPTFPEIATRRGSIDLSSYSSYLPNPDPVLRRKGIEITAYRDLLIDAHVGACVKSRKAGVKSLLYGVDYGKPKLSRQAKFIDGILKTLDVERIISEILDAVLFGYQALEVIWDQDGSFIVPKNVLGKPQNWFVFDEENNLMLRTKDNPDGIFLPERKFLLVQYESSYNNPYGFPELSRCFWPVMFKKGSIKFWAVFAEKYGMPFIIGKQPRSASKDDTERLAGLLDAMVQDAIAVIPDDSSVEIQSGLAKGGASSNLYSDFAEFLNNEISKAILGQTLTTQMGKTGSYSASQTHMEVRDDIVVSDKKLVEQAFNTLIKWIAEINFSGGDVPEFSLWAEEDVDQALAERDKSLTASMQLSGLILTQTYYQKNYSLEDEDIEIGAAPATAAPQSGNATGGTPPTTFASTPGDAVPQVAADVFTDQTTIDNVVFSNKMLQAQVEALLKPFIEMIQNGESYEAVIDNLASAYPDMDTKDLISTLDMICFTGETHGRLNAK